MSGTGTKPAQTSEMRWSHFSIFITLWLSGENAATVGVLRICGAGNDHASVIAAGECISKYYHHVGDVVITAKQDYNTEEHLDTHPRTLKDA